MFAKSKKSISSISITETALKFAKREKYHKNRHLTINENRYYSRPSQDQSQNQFSMRERENYRQRNHTQSKYNRNSAVTVNVRSKAGHTYMKYPSYSNSKSEGQTKNKYLFRPIEDYKEQRLKMRRQERLNKLKDGINIRKSTKDPKKVHSSIYNSNAQFNSFKEMDTKKLLSYSRQNKQKSEQGSKQKEVNLPRFFDYYNKMSQPLSHTIDVKKSQNLFPKTLPKSNRIIKTQQDILTPLLVPATLQQKISREISFDWVRRNYKPFLQIFEKISMDNFLMVKTEQGVYFGQLRSNSQIFQGNGCFFYNNGKVFQGHFINNLKQGFGYQRYPDKSSYLGNFQKGRRCGKGRFEWNNGQAYDGQWKNGKKQGSGIWKSGDVSYVGGWQADTIQGFGVLIQKNTRYEGEFKNFMKWGNGSVKLQNGQTYTGSFKQNLPNGIGDYYWNNGDVYHGEFANGKRHGEGHMKYGKGGNYKGQFKNDKKSGYGQQQYEDKLFYQGQFQNDLKHGWGTLYCNRDVLFQGYWLNNAGVDPTKGVIETIVEEQSIYEKDFSMNSQMKKIESSSNIFRNKIMSKKLRQQRLNSKERSLGQLPKIKPFKRACNCQRHRRINQQLP